MAVLEDGLDIGVVSAIIIAYKASQMTSSVTLSRM